MHYAKKYKNISKYYYALNNNNYLKTGFFFALKMDKILMWCLDWIYYIKINHVISIQTKNAPWNNSTQFLVKNKTNFFN